MLGDDELGMVKALLYIAEGENRSKEVIEKIQDLLNVIVQIGEPDKMVLMEQHG
tara:strand:- start:631 stop:792 length:162 start_codon:yes stop_codon:yes gene_type:complete